MQQRVLASQCKNGRSQIIRCGTGVPTIGDPTNLLFRKNCSDNSSFIHAAHEEVAVSIILNTDCACGIEIPQDTVPRLGHNILSILKHTEKLVLAAVCKSYVRPDTLRI